MVVHVPDPCGYVRLLEQGNCGMGNTRVECTAELKYGLEGNSVVSAWYGDSECTNLYGANFQAYGCVDGHKAVCEGGGKAPPPPRHFRLRNACSVTMTVGSCIE